MTDTDIVLLLLRDVWDGKLSEEERLALSRVLSERGLLDEGEPLRRHPRTKVNGSQKHTKG
jgi:hypothetical protein